MILICTYTQNVYAAYYIYIKEKSSQTAIIIQDRLDLGEDKGRQWNRRRRSWDVPLDVFSNKNNQKKYQSQKC